MCRRHEWAVQLVPNLYLPGAEPVVLEAVNAFTS